MSTPELYFEECSECKKKFHSNVELKVHMKLMHQKIDEFNCNICDRKFKRRWNLRSHLNFVHGVQENKGNFFFLILKKMMNRYLNILLKKVNRIFHRIHELISNFVFSFLRIFSIFYEPDYFDGNTNNK